MLEFINSQKGYEGKVVNSPAGELPEDVCNLNFQIYTSQKYTDFTLKSKSTKDIRYYPNTTFNLGIGATYNNFALNFDYGFGFLNRDQRKGKTKYLDLQTRFYGRKWVTDLEGQFYKGYHLSEAFQLMLENIIIAAI